MGRVPHSTLLLNTSNVLMLIRPRYITDGGNVSRIFVRIDRIQRNAGRVDYCKHIECRLCVSLPVNFVEILNRFSALPSFNCARWFASSLKNKKKKVPLTTFHYLPNEIWNVQVNIYLDIWHNKVVLARSSSLLKIKKFRCSTCFNLQKNLIV